MRGEDCQGAKRRCADRLPGPVRMPSRRVIEMPAGSARKGHSGVVAVALAGMSASHKVPRLPDAERP
jgi:hypothetical protein